MNYQSLIIIGAPRSGTNMLRNILCRLPGFGTWPCDEINYIWRYGNARWPSDEFPAELATERVKKYIGGLFDRRSNHDHLNIVVEKTCANSLRVPYVDEILPSARYLFIYRRSEDCVASAVKRWSAPFEVGYTLRKLRFVPLSDIPYYTSRFIRNRCHRLVSKDRRLAAWGPGFDGMPAALARLPLVEVSAMQWNECVRKSCEAFGGMRPDKWHGVCYEDFVTDPENQLADICRFIGMTDVDAGTGTSLEEVSAGSIGKHAGQLGAECLEAVRAITAPGRTALERLFGRSAP